MEWQLTLSADTFRDLATAASAASTDKGRDVLRGVLLELEGDTIRAVGTDSYRLAVIERPFNGNLNVTHGDFQPVILDAVALSKAVKSLPKAGDVVLFCREISPNDHYVELLTADKVPFEVVSIIDGNFPNYRTLLTPVSAFVSADSAGGALAGLALNVSLLSKAAKVAPWNGKGVAAGTARFYANGNTRPFLMLAGVEGNGTRYYQMPVRIS